MQPHPGAPAPPPATVGYHVDPSELRHPYELHVLAATWVVALIGVVLLGIMVPYGNYILIALGTSVALNFLSTFRAIGSQLRVGPEQFPEVDAAAREAAARLAMEPLRVYIYQSPHLESRTVWTITGYYVSLSSALVEALDTRELQCIIGQRFGEAKLGAGPMRLITGEGTDPVFNELDSAQLGGTFGNLLAQLSFSLSMPGRALFSFWSRLRGHANRRAGLVAVQDIRVCLTAIVKEMVGPRLYPYMNLPALVEQAQDMERRFASALIEAAGGMNEAMYVNQIRELLRWYKSPQYQQIAARQGKLGTGTLSHASSGTGSLFGAVAHQAQASKGLFSHDWDRLPPPQPVPQGYKLYAHEFRHPHEWATLLGSWAAGIVAIVLLNAVMPMAMWVGLALIPTYLGYYFRQMSSLGLMVRVTPQQFPGLYHLLSEAAARLDMEMPPTYIKQDPAHNAYAAWVWPFPRYVVVHTGMIEHVTPKELQCDIGHEYGHLKLAHTPLSLFFHIGPARAVPVLLKWVAPLLKFWFSWWKRSAEISADRAGLIACQDIRAAMGDTLKMATGGQGTWDQLNIPALVDQLAELDRKTPLHLQHLAQSVLERSHPFVIFRARELARFYKSPQFQQIVSRMGRAQTGTLHYAAGGTQALLQGVAHQMQEEKDARLAARAPAPAPAPAATPVPAPAPAAPEFFNCPGCGGANRPGAKFCGHCGHRYT